VTLPPFEGGPRSRNPLPFLRITRELDGGEAQLPQNPVSVRPAVALEDETTAAVSRITENLPEPRVESLEPRVLPVDRSTTEKGPAAALSTIATGAFAEGRYSEAERLLENLLSISLPDDVAARSHFYLAQTYYFTGRPRPAFLEFMLAREGYYLETRPFVDRILSEL
jgi:TolA-binding protein